jgi:sortase B
MEKGWKIARQICQIGDRILNGVIALILIGALLFSGYGFYDSWSIIQGAKLDNTVMQFRPTLGDTDADNPSLSELQEINPDIVGWLTVDNTTIDYPVVIGQTNQDYLNWDVYGEFSLSGSIFLDYRNSRDLTDFYSLIYGHHMAGNVMFGQLPEFLEDEFFQSHTTGTLFLPDRTIQIEWFACLETDAYDAVMFFPNRAKTEEGKQKLLDYVGANASQFRDLDLTISDQIVALSTCQDGTTNGRCILVGRVVN